MSSARVERWDTPENFSGGNEGVSIPFRATVGGGGFSDTVDEGLRSHS